jgi:hypothetical protein
MLRFLTTAPVRPSKNILEFPANKSFSSASLYVRPASSPRDTVKRRSRDSRNPRAMTSEFNNAAILYTEKTLKGFERSCVGTCADRLCTTLSCEQPSAGRLAALMFGHRLRL